MVTSRQQAKLVLITITPLIVFGLLKGFWVESLFRFNPLFFWLADVFHYIVMPILGVYFLGIFAEIWPRDYGFNSLFSEYSKVEIVGLFVLIPFLYWFAYSPIKSFFYAFFWESAASWGYSNVIPTQQPLKNVVNVYLSLTAAFVEEAVFRSLPWLFFDLRFPMRKKVWIYVVTTSVIFAMLHWPQGIHAVIATLSLGILSSYLFSKFRNIWPFVVAHFCLDFAIFS